MSNKRSINSSFVLVHMFHRPWSSQWLLTWEHWRFCRYIEPCQPFLTNIASLVDRLSYHMLWASGVLDPRLKPHQCMYASKWIEMAQPPCWPPRGQQVSHQKWLQGFACMQMMKYTREEIHPGFKTQGRRHQKSKKKESYNSYQNSPIVSRPSTASRRPAFICSF